jgi:DNA-directed RNA polymerase specialized sigma24 family protein
MYKTSRRTKVYKKLEICELLGNEINTDYSDYSEEEDNAFELLTSRVKSITSKWKPYDRKLFELYFLHGQSLRQIANGANIGLNSIHNSVKSYREIMREELSEDLIDYFNEDYDKIL